MKFLRLHWFDVGIALALITACFLIFAHPDTIRLILGLSLVSLFVHQFEEYRWPGYFPGMMNVVMYKSAAPDRYPLNTNTALIVNAGMGWLSYILALIFGKAALWLGIATILVSLGNFVAHTFLFNIRGRTFYNPGMFTAIVLFAPTVAWFGYAVIGGNLAGAADWIGGIALGIALNVAGILKMIDWLKNEDSPYVFPKRFLIPTK